MIDDFDQGIYPSRVVKLIGSLHQIAKEKHLYIILSTHNAALLNDYNNNEKNGISVVYREKDGGGSKIVSLPEINEYFESVLNGNGVGSSMMDDLILNRARGKREK